MFWFGDLNYRIDMSNEDVRLLIKQKNYHELLEADQVRYTHIHILIKFMRMFMRKTRRKNITLSCLHIFDNNTCAFICEEVNCFGLENINFQTSFVN